MASSPVPAPQFLAWEKDTRPGERGRPIRLVRENVQILRMRKGLLPNIVT